MTPDLLILSATDFEISHFLNLYPEDSKRFTRTGLKILSGRAENKRYDLMITAPGGFNAAHALTVYLEKSIPALVLQVGIAGIFKETCLNIGDVAIASNERYIHTGIQTDSLEKRDLPFDLIDAAPLTRKGIYSFDQNLIDHYYEILSRIFFKKELNMVKGPFITVSSITSSFEQAGRLYKLFSPVMEAMEGAACAHIAALYNIAVIEVRSGSNFVGERDKTKWNISLASENLGSACAGICLS